MSATHVFVQLHASAPAKPAVGADCNGCGACCAAEPCPVSRLLLAHRVGACPALTWRAVERRYVCGMVTEPARHLRWLPVLLEGPLGRIVARSIAVRAGCDFDAEVS